MLYKQSLTETILKCLLYKTHSFKEVREIIRKYNLDQDVSDSSLKSTLTRLKKKGLVARTAKGWSSQKPAEIYLKKANKFPKIKSDTLDSKYKNSNQMIVIYDIPETMRKERDWLRGELRLLGFKQIQLSVWLGPSPLPKIFIKSMNNLNILKFLNFFKVKEEDIV